MPAPFEALEDRLLRGGIAPRHVKRYLRELAEHLADLTQAQRDLGYDETDAIARARAALGPDAELADAMLRQRDFRAISARFPWLVFGLMPPFALILGFLLVMIGVVLVGFAGGVLPTNHNISPVPLWYGRTAGGLVFAANFLVTTALAFLMVWIAQRQRLKPLWPLLGMAIILLMGMHGDFSADTRRISIGLGTLLPFYPVKGPFGPQGTVHWPTLLGQGALLCLPLAWLFRVHRKAAA